MVNTTNQSGLNVNTGGNTNSSPANANVASNTNAVPSGWLTFTDNAYGFSFEYPKDWRVSRLPQGATDGSTAQLWPGAISVRYPQAQEELPSFKALSGNYETALKWLNDHIGPFAANGKTMTIGGLDGRVVTRGNPGNSFAIVEPPGFTLIVFLDPINPDRSEPTTANLYQKILDSVRYTAP